MPDDPVIAIQRFYPQIYLACHADHVRAVSTSHRLSAQDSSVLAHLDEQAPTQAGELARHLGVAASSLSATIKRLATLGYLTRQPRPRDQRIVELRLTARGGEAMSATSVLDRARVAGMLAELSPPARKRAVAGLAALAQASRSFQHKHTRRRKSR
jgi:DNA-binding MarR family transcriptional regulator